MFSLFIVVRSRPKSSFTVCWILNPIWRCVLYKIMFSQCVVDKFPYTLLMDPPLHVTDMARQPVRRVLARWACGVVRATCMCGARAGQPRQSSGEDGTFTVLRTAMEIGNRPAAGCRRRAVGSTKHRPGLQSNLTSCSRRNASRQRINH